MRLLPRPFRANTQAAVQDEAVDIINKVIETEVKRLMK